MKTALIILYIAFLVLIWFIVFYSIYKNLINEANPLPKMDDCDLSDDKVFSHINPKDIKIICK